MNQAVRERIKEKKLGPLVVDKSSTIIECCWVPVPQDDGKSTRGLEEAVMIIKSANETILVLSKYITHHEIVDALSKASERGVRIYCLVGEIKYHQNLDNLGTIRQREGISSSLVVADPKGEQPSGFFFIGELTSREVLEAPPIILDEDQARNMGRQFMHLFWNGASAERYGGITIDAMPLVTPSPPITAYLNGTFRIAEVNDIASILGSGRLEELWLPKTAPSSMIYMAPEADRVVVEVCDALKKKLSWKDLAEKEVLGMSKVPFLLARTTNAVVVAGPDLGLVLNDSQASFLLSKPLKVSWKLKMASPLSKLSGSVIRFESNWDNKDASTIEEEMSVDEPGTAVALSMDDWVAEVPGPEDLVNNPLVKKWSFYSTLAPPRAPRDAVQDRLYTRWKAFNEEKNRVCKELSSKIVKLQGNVSDPKRLSYTESMCQLKGILEEAAGVDLSTPTSISEADRAIAEISRAENELNKILIEISSNEPEEEPDEVEIMRKRPNTKISMSKGLANKVRELKPTSPLPRMGRLLEDGKGQKYLEIDFTDEISDSKSVAKHFHAIVVAAK